MKKIALITFNAGPYGRGVMQGVGDIAGGERSWLIQCHPPSASVIDQLIDWKPDGLIAELWDDDLIARVVALGVPMVNVADVRPIGGVPLVTVDSDTIGRLAANYLASKQFTHFGYLAPKRDAFAVKREAGFCAVLEPRGFTVSTLYAESTEAASHGWAQVDDGIRQWILRQPKPLAVFACNDGWALRLIEAVRQTHLDVPDDVAVLGVDNDALLCELSRPRLSSVAVSAKMVGIEAAKLLRRLMRGQAPPALPVMIPPSGVVTRESSDVLAIDDPDVAAAVRLIRRNAHRCFKSSELIDELAISRRSLERRFSKLLGRTLLDEIHRAHVERAKQLLLTTSLAMPDIADRAGFADVRRLSMIFKAKTDMSPSAFRRRFQSGN